MMIVITMMMIIIMGRRGGRAGSSGAGGLPDDAPSDGASSLPLSEAAASGNII